MAQNPWFQLSGIPLGILIPLNIWLGIFIVLCLLSVLYRQDKVQQRKSKTARKLR